MMTDKVGMVMTSRGREGEDDDRKAENGDDFDAGSDNKELNRELIERPWRVVPSFLGSCSARLVWDDHPPGDNYHYYYQYV